MKPTRAPRASYAEAGAAMRRALQRAGVNDLSRSDWRVLGAAIYLTASYSRTVDFIYVAQVVRLAGLSERRAGESLRRLAAFGVIEWEPGRGRGKPSLLSLPPSGKGGPTVVQIPTREKGTPSRPAFRGEDERKPDDRKAAIRASDTREGSREEIKTLPGRSGSKTTEPGPARPGIIEWTCDVPLKFGEVCGSTFESERALERHRTEAHWNVGELAASLLREMPSA